ncbi:hypothetical protein JW968_07545 [Candidatus Woesearchaeota archaeon]|nr:hypothetical protein [Candidatus Woesearchaeota archaeon]
MRRETRWISVSFIFLAMALIQTGSASGFGVSPAWQDHDFEAGKSITSKIRIINDENEDFRALVYVRGMFADKIQLEQQIYDVDASQREVTVPFTFRMPDMVFNPGKHTTEILILKLPQTVTDDEIISDGEIRISSAEIAATPQVVAKFNIKVPYEGKYLDGMMYVSQANAEQPTTFSIALYSLGTEDISSIKGVVEIVDPSNITVDKVETDTISLNSRMEGRIKGSWAAARSGDYTAVAKIDFDGKELVVRKRFTVGNLMINITNIAVEHYKLGEIVKFDIYLQSLWNKPLDDVYGVFRAYEGEKELMKYKTASVNLEPGGYGTINAFWDTEDMLPGTYTIKLGLYYANQKTESEFEAKMDYDIIEISRFGVTGHVVGEESRIGMDSILATLVIILIIINLIWFYHFRKRKDSKESKRRFPKRQKIEPPKPDYL